MKGKRVLGKSGELLGRGDTLAMIDRPGQASDTREVGTKPSP